MEFIVPDKKSAENESIEFITVSNELPPDNLPSDTSNLSFHKTISVFFVVIIATDEDLKKDKEDDNKWTCCKHAPHDTFPGIEHYFNISSKPQEQLFNKDKRIVSFEETDDDDNDVIMSNDQK